MTTIFDLPTNEKDAVIFFQEKGILHHERICENGHKMHLCISKESAWRCYIHSCRKKKGIRVDNWFNGSRIPFLTALRFIYCWSEELTSVKWCNSQLSLAENAASDWNSYMREVCSEYLAKHSQGKIGGLGKIVEFDGDLFVKRKNTGKAPPEQWMFGGICRETNKCFLVEVLDGSIKTLMNIIEEHINDETTIYSDCFQVFRSDELDNAGFHHFSLSHKYTFVNPATSADTQQIKQIWDSARWRNKKQRGMASHQFKSYLSEFMWRQCLGPGNAFDAILASIAELCPPK